MRVTNKQMLSLITRSVATSSELLLKAQERVASRKLINRPSDDPIGMVRVLDYRRKLSSIDQYIRNIASTRVRIESTVIYLEKVHGLLSDAKSIAINQPSQDDALGRETAAREVGKIYDWIRDLANSRLGGKYIFAGHDTDTIPFPRDEVTTGAESTLDGGEYFNISSSSTDYYVWYEIDGDDSKDPEVTGRTEIKVPIVTLDNADDVAAKTKTAIDGMLDLDLSVSVADSAVTITNADEEGIHVTDYDTGFSFNNATYNGDSGKISVILGEGVTQVINAHGNEVFTGSDDPTDGVNIFSVLKDLKFALEASVYDPVTVGNQIGELTKGITQIEKVLSKQATTFKRLEQTEGHWEKLKQNFEKALSDTEDADMAQVVVELMAQQTAYEMALASAAGVLQRNLLDFLR